MDRRLLDAGVDRSRIDVEAIQLLQNFWLVRDGDAADCDAILTFVGKNGFVAEQEKGARLRLDPAVGALRLHAKNGSQVVRRETFLEEALFRPDVVKKFPGDPGFIESDQIEPEIEIVLLRVGELRQVGEAAHRI